MALGCQEYPNVQNTTCLESLKIHKSYALKELLMMKSSGEATKTFTTNSYRCTAKQDSSDTIPLLQIVTVAAFVLIVLISFGCCRNMSLFEKKPELVIGVPVPMGQVISEPPKATVAEELMSENEMACEQKKILAERPSLAISWDLDIIIAEVEESDM